MPAAADNPDGFWENLRFVKLNDEILNALGAAWDLPPRSESSFDSDTLAPQRAKAHLLLNSFADHHKWGWKDPRNCLTLPFWQSLIPALKTVLIIRNPLEVAYSMNRRNGTSYALGLRLWEIYNRRLLAHTAAQERVITHYEAFFSDPQNELLRIANFLGLDDASKIAEAVALVAVNRRHTAFTVEQMIDAGVSEPIVSLYRRMLEASEDTAARDIQDKNLVESEDDPLSGTESRLQTSIPDSEGMRQELAQRRGAETSHRQEVDRHQKTIEGLRQELALNSIRSAAEINRRDGRIEELQKAYAHLDQLLFGEQTQRTQLFGELERVRRESWEQLEAARRELERVRHEYKTRDEAARQQLARDQDEIKALRQHIERLHHNANEARQQSERDQAEIKALQRHLEQLQRSERDANEARQQFEHDQAEIKALQQHLERLEREADEYQNRDEAARQQLVRDQGEIAQLRERFVQTNELLQKTSIRLTEYESRNASLTERLRKQLLEMKKFLRLLDQIEHAANLLRSSRRWKMANPFATLLAPITGKALPGFGHLDKNVEKYRAWRNGHPEVASLEDEIQSLRPREILSPTPDSKAISTPQAESTPSITPSPPKDPVTFVHHNEVDVSIIIPAYNQVDFTHACLAAIQKHSGDIPYEVIVADDASADSTQEVIGSIPGLIYLREEENAGFIATCNRGAAAARGRYLVFLNNDTIVTAGWLEALHETFTFEPDAGLVGSKLVYPDGRLQEAGGIIWSDGSGWNRGKFQDPAKPEYNYLREVDYCSAASVMIPKLLFEQLGGFDPKYAPAYYEDTDLAFKVAQAGRKVLYQPLSVVVHHEGITAGTDVTSGAKRYQDINRQTFISTWATVLAGKPENGDVTAYEALPAGRMRVLVIDHHLPMPDRDSGSLRMFQLLTILHRLGHRITFLPDNLADIPPYADDLRKRGIEVMHHPYAKQLSDYLQSYGPAFDTVILSRCDFAQKHIDNVRRFAPQSRVIFDTVDLHFLRTGREAQLTDHPATKAVALEKEQMEYELIDKADETWVVSTVEQTLLKQQRPTKSIQVVSNIVDIPGSAMPFSQRKDFLFIGSFQHPPNTDGVLFFAREILPLVRQELGPIKFYIIGDKAPPEVVALADGAVIVTGLQKDVSPYFDSVKLSVAPLRYGAGVKGKINQSMGFGVPVVATSVAVEGMSLQDAEDVMIADEPALFAKKLVALYQSEELWERISRNGIAKTERLFSVGAARAQLSKLLGDWRNDDLPVSPLLPAPFPEPVRPPVLRPS